MIKLKDILFEDVSVYSVSAVLVTDKDVNFTDVVDNIRGIRKVTTVNVNTSPEIEAKNRSRKDGKEVHTCTIKFISSLNTKADLDFLKTTMLKSKKGDPNKRIEGLRHIIFKPESLTKI